ncbi:hypothetical protein jhhlp_007239 [Lomentospora prolificans]|uniref:Uncharacterized protein n=1 Tax=Lomentospora prolificans TaxID=41688 RepID=A0A2N3N241_9PEZI|nr:hypothetical protein jhhlp_007239 [Lomentospora prolificans]
MGFWDNDSISLVSKKSHGRTKYSIQKKSKSRSRSRSRSRSKESRHHRRGSASSFFFGGGSGRHGSSIFGGNYGKHSSSKSSFFSLPGGSRSSFFGLGNRSSYYKRSPRKGFMHRAYKKLKEILRDIVKYAKRHPMKVFLLLLVPLITGGALTALLARFGLRLPAGIERLLGVATRAAAGDSSGLVGEAMRMAGGIAGGSRGAAEVGRGRDGDFRWERKSETTSWGGDGWGDGISTVMKMFK